MNQKVSEKNQGMVNVVVTYVCWGLLTAFWNLLAKVNPVCVLFQRVVWSAIFMLIYLLLRHRLNDIIKVFKDKRTMSVCLLSGTLMCLNWGVFIYAVSSGHVLDSSLGYFIEPIVVTVIGVLFFKERLSKLEKLTIVFSVIGLAYLVFINKRLPLVSIAIGVTFALYGAVKKNIQLDADMTLFQETITVTPVALLGCILFEISGTGAHGILNGAELLLLPASGVVTSVPLLFFSRGIKQLPFYLAGIFMYINPTIQFLMGVFYFKEPIDINRVFAFSLIWVGVALTIYHNIGQRKETNGCSQH